jgi:pantoate--beta-alanine ligase
MSASERSMSASERSMSASERSTKPQVFESMADWRRFRARESLRGMSLGFVPTMGALHAGHASLVRRAAAENDRAVVSIFVNPTQFDDPKDLEKYPRTLERDLAALGEAGADFVILPDPAQMYPDGYRYRVTEGEESRDLCGAHRPGHFDGVLTVVMKLLNLAQAERAYFGEKDFQQLKLVRGMAEAFFHPTEIVACPTVREADGLAMSSRNALLSEAERRFAARFPRLLAQPGKSAAEVRAELERAGFRVDYVEEKHGRRLAAVHVGAVRLIDNVAL